MTASTLAILFIAASILVVVAVFVANGNAEDATRASALPEITDPSPPDSDRPSLDALLQEARVAMPNNRIEYRDAIAAFGTDAIKALEPWVADRTLGSFAVRVLARAASIGHEAEVRRVLTRTRWNASEPVRGDIDDILYRLDHVGLSRKEWLDLFVHRQTHCWNCKGDLTTRTNAQCDRCGWLVCDQCGECRDPRWGGKCSRPWVPQT